MFMPFVTCFIDPRTKSSSQLGSASEVPSFIARVAGRELEAVEFSHTLVHETSPYVSVSRTDDGFLIVEAMTLVDGRRCTAVLCPGTGESECDAFVVLTESEMPRKYCVLAGAAEAAVLPLVLEGRLEGPWQVL